MKRKPILCGFLFLILSLFLIAYALTTPCDIGPITQTQGNVTVEVNQPVEMNRMVCLTTDFSAFFAVLAGSAAIFPAVSGIFKGLTD